MVYGFELMLKRLHTALYKYNLFLELNICRLRKTLSSGQDVKQLRKAHFVLHCATEAATPGEEIAKAADVNDLQVAHDRLVIACHHSP